MANKVAMATTKCGSVERQRVRLLRYCKSKVIKGNLQLQRKRFSEHTHINRFYLFASVAIIILPCNLASAQDEPNPLLQVGDNDDGIALTERLPTASTFDDLTTMADSADFVPMELYNVSYFEEVVWPIFIGDFSNDSDELLCSARNHTEHLVDFTSGGLELYCKHYFDGLFCWAPTPADTTVYRPCKNPYNGVEYQGNVSRTCLPNGTWADGGKSDFDCEAIEDDPFVDSIHKIIQHKVLLNIGYVLSLAALIGAFFIFLFFKSLRCVRNNIHWNLITSFIILYVLFYIASATQKMATEQDELKWLCRMVMCLINNAVLTNFFWMLIEGVYLHLLVVRAMTVRRERFWMYMIFGRGCPIIFTLLHLGARIYSERVKEGGADNTTTPTPIPSVKDLGQCWLDPKIIDYLIYGPVIACVLINLVILIHVIAILVSKLRATHSFETQQYWKSVRATFILLPLLGGAYFLFIHKPEENSLFSDIHGYFQVFLQALQGFFVALFYVYMNQEVVLLLKRKYRRWQESHSIQVPRTSLTYHSIIPFSRKSSIDSNVPRKSNKLYPPEKVPPFVPGEVVPLQCKMDCTPTLGTDIQEWAQDEKIRPQLPNGSLKNGVLNGTTTPLISSNGNNNEMEGSPLGDTNRSELNSNNHNDSTYTSVGTSPDVDNCSVFSEDIPRSPGVNCYQDMDSAREPLVERKSMQRPPSTSSSCPLLEVDQRAKQVESHAKWSPKVLLKKLNPHVSMQQSEVNDRPAPIPEVKVDSIQFTETPCGTPV